MAVRNVRRGRPAEHDALVTSAGEHQVIDEYGLVGIKLAFLLGVEPSAGLLLVGPRAAAWQRDGEQAFAPCDAIAGVRRLRASAPYGLVVWDPSAERDGSLAGLAAELARAMSDRGRLLLLGVNRWSLSAVLQPRQGASSGVSWSLRGYRRALAHAGFRGVRTFLAMPYLAAWEEAVASRGERPELASYTHWVLRAASRVGLLPWLHDGLVVVAGRDGCPLAELERRLAAVVDPAAPPGRYAITRFGLRSRGALIVTLRDTVARTGVIVRVAVTPNLDRRIARNAQRLGALLAEPRLPAEVRSRLPAQLATARLGGQRIYVEQRIEGYLAWQLAARPAVRARIEADALSFVNALARGTLEVVEADDALLDELLDHPVGDALGAETPEAARAAGLDVVRRLRKRLAGRLVPLVAGHGDFGIGNLIVGPAGDLRGVIDWDCSQRRELWGVDWLNHRLQLVRADAAMTLAQAARAVAPRLAEEVAGLWLEGSQPAERAELSVSAFHLACLRYVARAARYPSEFVAETDDFVAVLTWLRDQSAS